MRLVTHNMLRCNIKTLKEDEGYPLIIHPKKAQIIPAEYNEDLVREIFNKLNLDGLLSGINDIIKYNEDNQILDINKDQVDLSLIQDKNNFNQPLSENVLKFLHFFLFELYLMEGDLECPNSKRIFQVVDGIPNMLLHEDEL